MKKMIVAMLVVIMIVAMMVPAALASDATDLQTLVNGSTTVTLTKDYTIDTPIVITTAVTLDLAGHTVTCTGALTAEAVSGGANTDGLFIVMRGGNLTINDSVGGGKIDTNNVASVYEAVKMTAKGEAETGNAAKLTVNGGKLIGTYYAITGNGTRHNTEITINGGELTATATNDNLGIYHPQNGTLTINGGKITGYSSAVELRAGTLTINGGELEATAPTFSATPNGNGTTMIGAAVAVSQHDTNLPIKVTVTGGTLKGVNALYEEDVQDNTAKDAIEIVSISGGNFTGAVTSKNEEGFISGGTFSVAPADAYIKAGSAAKKDASGKFIISKVPATGENTMLVLLGLATAMATAVVLLSVSRRRNAA